MSLETVQPAPETPQSSHAEALQRLQALLLRYDRLIVAFSAGVDSTLLLKVAVDALGADRVLAVTGESESLARSEAEQADRLARQIGAQHRVLRTHELQDPNYVANSRNRCYFCKSELFDMLRALADAEGFTAIVDGTNLDDVQDFRPGRQAARERGILSPLLEAGLTKNEIRALSKQLGLPTWDKPEMPCLASRIPHGSPVDVQKLQQIERAEEGLRACGLRGSRVRHHGEIARLELQPEDLGRLTPEMRARIVETVRSAGFEYVTLDLEGYRKGRLSEVDRRPPSAAAEDAASV